MLSSCAGEKTRGTLPRLALLSLFSHELRAQPQPVSHLGVLDTLPLIGGYLKSADTYWADERRKHCLHASPAFARWGSEEFSGAEIAEKLFYDFYQCDPREVREIVTIMRQVERGQYAQAWQALARGRQRQPQTYRTLCGAAPGLYNYAELTAWHSGHLNELDEFIQEEMADTAVHSTADLPQCTRDMLANARLGTTTRVTRRCWSVQNGAVSEEGSATGRENSTYALALVPARQGMQLLAIRAIARTILRNPSNGGNGRRGTGVPRRPMPNACSMISCTHSSFLLERSAGHGCSWPRGTSAPDADFLALRKADAGGNLGILLRRDARGTRQLTGRRAVQRSSGCTANYRRTMRWAVSHD